MPASTTHGASQSEIDALELMIDRMNRQTPSRSNSPVPAFPPPRTSSRNSNHTGLSHHSSSRSLHSLHSFDSSRSRPSSPLSGRPSPDVGAVAGEEEDETTPSMRQGEWGRRAFSHTRARTTSDNRGLHRNYDDDTSSLRSGRTGGGSGFDASTMPLTNSFYGSSTSSSAEHPPRRSPQTSPRPRPRQAPSLGSTPPLSLQSSGPSLGQSPLRLLPRSPLNDRTPLEDLTFFREVGAFSPEDETWTGSLTGDSTLEPDTSSIRSANSSIRNARLREDIEQTAQRIKDRAANAEEEPEPTSSGIAGPSTSSPPQPPTLESSPDFSASRRGSGFASSLPLYPGAPIPAVPLTSPPEYSESAVDARSLRSVVSGTDSTASHAGTWATPSITSSSDRMRTDYYGSGGSGKGISGGANDRTERVRQKESKEWSQACWIWVKDKSPNLSSGALGGGKFSKAPLIRDVPSVMKRKSGKRESAHHLSPAEAMLLGFDDPSSSKSSSKSSSSKDKVKEKDKDKGKSPIGPVSGGRDGSWRRSTGVLRDDGLFRVFGESDKIVIHSIHLPSYNRTDVRLVDHSLFGRPNCVSISHRTASPVTPHRSSFHSAPMGASNSSDSPRSTLDEPVYLCFPSVVATQVWLVMAHCFARPEFYLASGAATPRPLRSGKPTDPSWPSSSDEGEASDSNQTSELDKSCRIYRKLYLVVNEGRSLGESMSESTRPGAKTSWERPGMMREGSGRSDGFGGNSLAELQSPGSLDSPNKSNNTASSLPAMKVRTGDGKDEHSGTEWFCEIEMDGEVVARTAVRRGHSPFWNESFVFSDLPPFTSPLIVRVLQSSKSSSRIHILGSATIRVPDLPRHQLCEDWWSVKPANPGKMTEVVGELSIGVRVGEEVVLPSREYEPLLRALTEDVDAELAADLAQEFPSDLEEVTTILLRIYQAESILVPRLLRLADIEIDSNSRLGRTSAILFRGNTVLTKSVELYLRLIGAEYLEASIGETIRKIVKDRVEIEIDPMKLKSGWKDKELLANVHNLHEWTTTLWNSIYDAREKCPQDLRQIFGHIQRIVVEKYGTGEEQKNTRWTSVSAFIFLRFFVPAVLNPRLFFIVSAPPDPKSQRTLTLIAKTLQGLANFSSFGQKEPWMLPMNSFVQDNGAAFVDFIEHVATPSPPSAYRQEWTSPLASTYLAPYRLRNTLAPLAKEGVALLPHLIDLPRELGLLATHLARWYAEKGSSEYDGSFNAGRSETSSVISTPATSSHKFAEVAETCAEVHDEARRRGGGLISAVNYYDLRSKQPNLRTRAASRMAGRPATAGGAYGAIRSGRTTIPSRPSTASTTEELHIRNPPRPVTPPPMASSIDATADGDELPGRNSTASRRSHRSFTINGSSPRQTITTNGQLRSISNEDLSLLASIQTAVAPVEPFGVSRSIATSPTPPTLNTLDAFLEQTRALLGDEDSEVPTDEEQPMFDTEQTHASHTTYQFPPVSSSTMNRGSSNPTPVSIPMSKASSTHSSSATSTASRSTRHPPTSKIRITQETTTVSTHIADLLPSSAAIGTSVSVSAAHLEELILSPTTPSPSTAGNPYESEFGSGTLGFSTPLRSQVASSTSSPVIGSTRSMGSGRGSGSGSGSGGGGGLPSSASSMSISAEVTGPPSLSSSRRASSAGIMAGFGLGKHSRNGGGGDEDGSSGSGGSSGKGGLLSRAMGRKGSRAS